MIGTKLKIKCVLEGFEENALFELVEKYGVSDNIELTYKNAEGGGNVGAYFYDYYSSGDYDLVLCVYDVDYSKDDSKKMYLRIYNDLLEILGDDELVKEISICTNPNILLILLLAFDNKDALMEISGNKADNTSLINKYVPKIGNKKDYDASSWQLQLIKDEIEYPNKYETLLLNTSKLDEDYLTDTIGSNIYKFLKALKDGDIDYFNKIIDKL